MHTLCDVLHTRQRMRYTLRSAEYENTSTTHMRTHNEAHRDMGQTKTQAQAKEPQKSRALNMRCPLSRSLSLSFCRSIRAVLCLARLDSARLGSSLVAAPGPIQYVCVRASAIPLSTSASASASTSPEQRLAHCAHREHSRPLGPFGLWGSDSDSSLCSVSCSCACSCSCSSLSLSAGKMPFNCNNRK